MKSLHPKDTNVLACLPVDRPYEHFQIMRNQSIIINKCHPIRHFIMHSILITPPDQLWRRQTSIQVLICFTSFVCHVQVMSLI